MRETFFQLCVYFTLCLFAVSLCVNFVSASGIYGEVGNVDQNPGLDYESRENTLFGIPAVVSETGINEMSLWGLILSGIGVITLVIGILTGGNTQIIAGWLFSSIFWASWLSLIIVTDIGSFIPAGISAVATALMVPIFIGGLIGIFSGSG